MLRCSLLFFSAVVLVLFLALHPRCQAAPQAITVCSEVALSGTTEEARKKAWAAVQSQAVQKAVHTIVSDTSSQVGILSSIKDKFQNYVQSTQLLQEQLSAKQITLIAKVTVDVDALERDLSQLVRGENTNQHPDDTIGFYIRVTGAQENAFTVLQRYHKDFSDLGFKMVKMDQETNATLKYQGQSYADYLKAMESEIEQNPEISLAVIGEIELHPVSVDATACTAAGSVRLVAMNFADHQMIAEYNDQYTLRRSSEAEAYRFVLEKAALNSSKRLATEILQYWQKNRKG